MSNRQNFCWPIVYIYFWLSDTKSFKYTKPCPFIPFAEKTFRLYRVYYCGIAHFLRRYFSSVSPGIRTVNCTADRFIWLTLTLWDLRDGNCVLYARRTLANCHPSSQWISSKCPLLHPYDLRRQWERVRSRRRTTFMDKVVAQLFHVTSFH